MELKDKLIKLIERLEKEEAKTNSQARGLLDVSMELSEWNYGLSDGFHLATQMLKEILEEENE